VIRISPKGYIIAATLLAALGLSGCATMNRSECQTVDWRTVGYEDGVSGQSSGRIAQHRKACAKHGVAPDLDAYQSGREQGLREYCTADNGFRLGERGASLPAFCPDDRQMAFESAYRDGFHLYQLRASLNQAVNSLEAARREQHDIEHQLVGLSDLIVAKDTETAARAQALLDVKHLAERQGRLKSRIRQLEEERVLRQRDLDDYLFAANNPR
jgi:Protein of unknown function (DUF2799)